LFSFKHLKNLTSLKVSHVLSLTSTFSIKIDKRSTRERNAHAMQIVKATSSCRWPECGLWRQSAVRRSGNRGNGKRAGEEALTREAGAHVRFRFLSLSLCNSSFPVYSRGSVTGDIILRRKTLINRVSQFYILFDMRGFDEVLFYDKCSFYEFKIISFLLILW